MPTLLLKKTFHTDLCQRLLDDIQLNHNSYYYFLGRTASWISTDNATEGISDTNFSESTTRSELISFKKIGPEDVSFVTRRIDWVTGTVYDQYDSKVDLSDKNYYVMTTNYDVYKCISNNSGIPSISIPTGTSINTFSTPDGYIWKYMYSVPPVKRNRFLSKTKLPVQRALTDRFYSNGAITPIIVEQGTLYTEEATIQVDGDGSGAEFTPVIVDGSLVDIEVVSAGEGYTWASLTVLDSDIDRVDAVISAILDDSSLDTNQSSVEQSALSGAIYNVVPTTLGTGYSAYVSPTEGVQVNVIGDGSGCLVSANVSNGQITSYTVTNPGSGYTNAILQIYQNSPVRIEEVDAVAYAIISPQNGHGFDAVAELGADSLCLFSNIRYSAEDIVIDQDFREYGIIKNLRDITSNNLITDTVGSFTYEVLLNITISPGVDNSPIPDEILIRDDISGAKYRVIDFTPGLSVGTGTVILAAITNHPINAFDILKAETNTLREYEASVITKPDANKYSGTVLFVSDSSAFTFTDDQEITIKTYLKL